MEYFPELEGAFFLETFQDEDIFNSVSVTARVPPAWLSHSSLGLTRVPPSPHPQTYAQGRVIKSSADQYVYQMLEVAPPSLFSGIAGDKVAMHPSCSL